MQVLTTELLHQLSSAINDTSSQVAGALLSAGWQNIINFLPELFTALASGDWSAATVRLIILAGTVVFLYRLVRKMPFAILRSFEG